MNVFYNKEGVGDMFLIFFKDAVCEEISYEREGDVVRIFNKEIKEMMGFNIFNVFFYLQIEDNGFVVLFEIFVQDVNEILNRNGVLEILMVDFFLKFVVGYVELKEKYLNVDKLNIC